MAGSQGATAVKNVDVFVFPDRDRHFARARAWSESDHEMTHERITLEVIALWRCAWISFRIPRGVATWISRIKTYKRFERSSE